MSGFSTRPYLPGLAQGLEWAQGALYTGTWLTLHKIPTYGGTQRAQTAHIITTQLTMSKRSHESPLHPSEPPVKAFKVSQALGA